MSLNNREPVRLWCEQSGCSNGVLLFFRMYKPIVQDAIDQGWLYENDKWCCDKCLAKREESKS